MLPAIAKELGLSYSSREGWLSGIFGRVLQGKAPFELGVCFPVESWSGISAGSFLANGVRCYAFLEDLGHPEYYDAGLEKRFAEILEDFRPDMVHIFGTEFPHALAAIRVFGKPERTLLGIQGLCGEIAKVYMAGLPARVQRQVTFRDFIRRDSLRQQREKFILRGKNEAEIIKGCGCITGRTGFDREGTAKINPGARYFFMNETMREEFYSGSWNLSQCEKHSLFLGQGDYPLKGMHFVLEAMALLLPVYPDLKLYVAGNSVIERMTWKQRMKLPAYGKYLLELISRYGLEDKVIMAGKLSARQMKERFLACHTFLCPSVLENSPNTVGEAMLLGVPVIASAAGGIPDMVADGRNGLLFPAGNIKALAEAVLRMWDEEKDREGLTLSQRLSKQAALSASMTHDGETNYLRLLEIYGEMLPDLGVES